MALLSLEYHFNDFTKMDIKKYFLQFAFGFGGVYCFWITCHFFAAHAYIKFCCPPTLLGFLKTAVNAPSPHCRLLRISIFHFGDGLNQLWSHMTAYLLSTLIRQ
jgi:hypothetical protein